MITKITAKIYKISYENASANINDFIIQVTMPNQNNTLWKVKKKDLYHSALAKYKENETLTVIWNEKNYTTRLFISETETLKLLRDFSRQEITTSQKLEIDILKCNSCGNNIILSNDIAAKCDYCSAIVPLSENHSNTLKLSNHIKKNNEHLFNGLNAIFKGKLPSNLFKFLSFLPLFLTAIQILIIAYYSFFPKLKDFFSDEIINDFLMEDYNFALFLTLPTFILSILILFLGRKNVFATDVSNLFSLLSPQNIKNHQANCRSCGAPFKISKTPDFIVCSYCCAENIVQNENNTSYNYRHLHIQNLFDVKILHQEFLRVFNNYWIGVAIGITVFYSGFFAFTLYLDDLRHVPFIIYYIFMPFIILIILHLYSEIAFVPHNLHDNWLLKYYSDYFDNINEDNKEKAKIKISAYIISFIKIFCFIIFFIALFFLKK